MHARIKRALHGLVAPENHDVLIDRLASEGVVRTYMPGECHANAGDEKRSRLDRLDAAMASDDPAVRSSAQLLSGMLARAGITREQIAEGNLAALDKVFAASKLSISDRLTCKALLHRHGAI